MTRAVVGVDIGGSWTRALVLDPDSGARLGTGRSAGGNPVAHGVARASAQISAALREALGDAEVPAERVQGCVVGMAGVSKLAADAEAARAIDELWRDAGLACEVEIVGDVVTAFAAGCPEAQGSILLAGTGAIAATMADRQPADVRDGHGWLLGDEGSGFWIGREAVRATLAVLDDGKPLTGLTAAVLAQQTQSAGHIPGSGPASRDFGLDEGGRLGAALIAATNARPPVELATLAPLVADAADHGDRVALRILHKAAELLLATLVRARAQHETSPIVLAGGVLAPTTPVYRLVLAAVSETWPTARVVPGVDGAAGAAWLAAHRLLDDETAAARLHARLLPTI